MAHARGLECFVKGMGALITPILVLTLYLFFSRWPNWVVSDAADYSAVALASITGALWLLRLPVSVQEIGDIGNCFGKTIANVPNFAMVSQV